MTLCADRAARDTQLPAVRFVAIAARDAMHVHAALQKRPPLVHLVALLIANRLSEAQRKDIGWTLVAIGVVTTLPLALMVFDRQRMRRS